MKVVNVFVAAGGNGFMTDIAWWLVDAASLAGRRARLVTNGLPDDPDAVNLVVAPHEFFALNDADDATLNAAAAVSIPVGTEQPDTPWFQIGLSYCRPAALALDINPHGVVATRRAGIDVRRLALGAVPQMRAPRAASSARDGGLETGAERGRDLDVLFLGGDTPRRQRILASLAPALADRATEIRLFSFARPVDADTPGLVFGAEKYDLLSRARILVNVHRDDRQPGYFEWARMVEAMANGCAVVTEPCSGYEPLVPGRHFVETDDLPATVAELLADEARTTAIGDAAARAVLDEYPLVDSLRPILDHLDGVDLRQHIRDNRRRIVRNRVRRAHTTQLLPVFRPATAMRERVHRALLDEQDFRRRIEAARCRLRHGAAGHVTETTTPGHDAMLAAGRQPEVSAVVTLYNYAGVVTETLESLVASRDVDLELVVVDDHSSDDGRQVVGEFMTAHPDVPTLLLGRDDNHGLAAARNLGVDRALADKLMIVDADNLVYPRCLRALADALDADPAAAFAYATLEAFGTAPGLRSQLGWHAPWLCAANYIDAQAMVRRSTYERHGGYRDDDRWVYGWEDWDLWLRLATAGEHGVHVPQMLGRYRTQASSMIAITNLAADVMLERIEARYPTLPWP